MKKKLLSFALYYTGLWFLWRRKNRNKIVFLTIHGISDPAVEKKWQPLRSYLSTMELDAHISVLKRYYNFVSISEAGAMLRGERPLQPHSLVVTFDDGYENNIDSGFEVLKKHSVPMTLFVATGHAEQQKPFWFDRLDYAVQHNVENVYETRFGDIPVRFDMTNRETGKSTLVRSIRKILKSNTNDYDLVPKVEQFIASIESLKGKTLLDVYETDPNSKVATPEKLGEFASSPLATLGSHTKNHVRLNAQPENKILEELQVSKSFVEKLTGEPCHWFCFPNGACNDTAASLVEDAEYRAAFTTQEGHNSVGDYPYLLHRINLPLNIRPEQLACMVAGVYTFPKRDISTS